MSWTWSTRGQFSLSLLYYTLEQCVADRQSAQFQSRDKWLLCWGDSVFFEDYVASRRTSYSSFLHLNYGFRWLCYPIKWDNSIPAECLRIVVRQWNILLHCAVAWVLWTLISFVDWSSLCRPGESLCFIDYLDVFKWWEQNHALLLIAIMFTCCNKGERNGHSFVGVY